MGIFTITNGTFELWVDDRYAATPPDPATTMPSSLRRRCRRSSEVNPDFEHGAESLTGWRLWTREENAGSAAIAPEGHSGKRAARIRHEGRARLGVHERWPLERSARPTLHGQRLGERPPGTWR